MINAADLIASFGSPLYVYQLDTLAAVAAQLRGMLPAPATLFYSLKANPHPQMVAELVATGCRAEVSSIGELTVALQAGCPPQDCLYTGPGKTEGELRAAISRGVTLFSAESSSDVGRISGAAGAHGVVARCLLRINGVGGAARGAIRMTNRSSQFGFDLGDVDQWAVEVMKAPHVSVVGLHFFPMSNARSEQDLASSFVESIGTAAHLRDAYGIPMQVLDLGGGFAAPFAKPGVLPEYPALKSELTAALKQHFPEYAAGTLELAFESGRYLSGTAGALYTSVTEVKQSMGSTFGVLDAGINHLGGMSGLRRLMPVEAKPEATGDEPRTRLKLVGPLCAPSDVLATDLEIALPDPGDVLQIPNVGAYGLTASLLAFLSRDSPVELTIRGDQVISASRLVVARQPFTARPVHED
ncbi:type III PLP-dependent enzyme [Nonomuraea rhodomycinica]|uniref:Type III PLP-dependent enzyme n=1 Tax=Nonomuraea rhodomycinica TaxID=1712872 RepID=A0A7Y6II79_9ACTN|nr:type III PLP-dependent enzyme [Nonomuraea rhodomycinica]NUW38700.1 type III PLP-dependent enzyme [Nonomuraea rhodomycinica]